LAADQPIMRRPAMIAEIEDIAMIMERFEHIKRGLSGFSGRLVSRESAIF
jgi:hypothetical protein